MIDTRQVRLVAMREIRARMVTRAYRVSTILLAGLAIGALVATQTLPNFFEDDPFEVALLPAASGQAAALREAAPAFDREIETISYEDSGAAELALSEGEVDAVLVAPDEILFEEEPNSTLEAIVRQAVAAAQLEERATALGITLEEAQSLVAPVEVTSTSLEPAGPEDEDEDVGQGLGALSALALLMALTFYGNWVLVGVIEEKSNRVVEILLAAVRPEELLVGKVLGILALAVLQILVVLVALVVGAAATDQLDSLPSVAVTGVAMAVLWLAIGLMLYNFLYAAVGATVNRPDEATSVSFPLMIPLMGGYFVGLIAIPDNPDSLLARVLSIFPLTAPLTMPSRIASGGGSPLEVVIAVVLALATLVGIIWLAARIYSGGVLQTSRVGLATAFRGAKDIR